jgi:hypothetical protein
VVVDRQADPDGDGLNNSLEFGLGLDPKKADSSQPIEVLSGSAKGEKNSEISSEVVTKRTWD